MIYKFFFKVVCSISPVLPQVHCKVAGHNHATTIGHKTSLIKFTHQSINKWHTCNTVTPSFNNSHVSLPLVILSVVNSVCAKHFVAVMHAPVAIKISPKQFINKNFCAFIGSVAFFEIFSFEIYLFYRNTAV